MGGPESQRSSVIAVDLKLSAPRWTSLRASSGVLFFQALSHAHLTGGQAGLRLLCHSSDSAVFVGAVNYCPFSTTALNLSQQSYSDWSLLPRNRDTNPS
jgi:hypothetical protein